MRPARYATSLAIAYLLVGVTYIFVSGHLAARGSLTVEELHRVEEIKGLCFVGATSLLIFGLSYMLFRRLVRSAEVAARSRETFLAAERRATAGLLASSVAHDFRNLLVVLGAGVGELRSGGPGTADVLDDMAIAVRRATELAQRLSQAGRGSAAGRIEKIDVAAVVDATIGLLRLHPKAKQCSLVLRTERPISLMAYSPLVQQLVTNLVVNAFEATGDRGQVNVHVAQQDAGVVVEVHDDGPGVPEAVRSHLFEPFHTTKRDGTGLGLVSAKQCAELHGGKIELVESLHGGACFRVHLGDAAHGLAEVR